MKEADKCSEKVWDSTSWHSYPCSKKPIVEREGKMWCKIHDPEYKKAKEKTQDEKYKKDSCRKCEYHFDRVARLCYSYCPMCGTKIEKNLTP